MKNGGSVVGSEKRSAIDPFFWTIRRSEAAKLEEMDYLRAKILNK